MVKEELLGQILRALVDSYADDTVSRPARVAAHAQWLLENTPILTKRDSIPVIRAYCQAMIDQAVGAVPPDDDLDAGAAIAAIIQEAIQLCTSE